MSTVSRLSIEVKVDDLLNEADKTLSPSESLEKSLQAKSLSESIGYKIGLAKSLHRAATTYGQLGDYENALQFATQARELVKGLNDKSLETAAAQTIGTAFYNLGDYESALRFGYECLEIAQHINAPILMAKAYTTLGNTYFQLHDYPNARDVFEKCLSICTEMHHRYGQSVSLNNLANIHEQLNDYQTALDLHQKSLLIKEELGDQSGYAHLLISIGNCHLRLGKTSKAETTYKKSLAVSRKSSDNTGTVNALYSLGKLYNIKTDHQQAVQVLQQALSLLKEVKKLERLADVHYELSRAFEALGKLKQAIAHIQHHQSVREEMLNESVIAQTKKLQILHQVAQMAREREIFRLKAEQAERELTHKKQEIVSMAMSLVQKNELVEKLKANLSQLRRTISAKTESAEITESIGAVILDLDQAKSSEESWKLFEQQFESVHQDFIKTLLFRFPELTKAEVRLCVLLKIQLSTKEIAQLLFLSPRSVETYRLNLRRKFDLPANTNLTEFLLSF